MAMAMTNTFTLVNLIKLRLDVPYAEDCQWDADSEAEDGFYLQQHDYNGTRYRYKRSDRLRFSPKT